MFFENDSNVLEHYYVLNIAMFFNFCRFARKCIVNRFSSLHLAKRSISRSYYDILKVSPTCTSKEIRDAFIILSKQNHPDKHLNDPSMHEKFVQINEAYSTLINPSKRRAYDLTLYHKRKLNAPYDNSYTTERKSSAYSDTFHQRASSRGSSYTSNTGNEYYKDPFSWQTYDSKSYRDAQSNPKGFKRYSNSAVVSLLISFTVVGVILQLLAIRSSFISNQEKMLEKSREYGLIHRMAREKAKLYGNAHQIEVLKSKLDKSFESEQQKRKDDESSGEQVVSPSLKKGF